MKPLLFPSSVQITLFAGASRGIWMMAHWHAKVDERDLWWRPRNACLNVLWANPLIPSLSPCISQRLEKGLAQKTSPWAHFEIRQGWEKPDAIRAFYRTLKAKWMRARIFYQMLMPEYYGMKDRSFWFTEIVDSTSTISLCNSNLLTGSLRRHRCKPLSNAQSYFQAIFLQQAGHFHAKSCGRARTNRQSPACFYSSPKLNFRHNSALGAIPNAMLDPRHYDKSLQFFLCWAKITNSIS